MMERWCQRARRPLHEYQDSMPEGIHLGSDSCLVTGAACESTTTVAKTRSSMSTTRSTERDAVPPSPQLPTTTTTTSNSQRRRPAKEAILAHHSRHLAERMYGQMGSQAVQRSFNSMSNIKPFRVRVCTTC